MVVGVCSEVEDGDDCRSCSSGWWKCLVIIK